MPDIIKEKDPRGITISCSKDQWDSHIVLNHPIMQENQQAVAEAISSPRCIYTSHDSDPPLDYREVFCKETPSATYYSKGLPYTKVVVSVLGGTGEIITAFPAKNETGGTVGEALYHE